MLEWRAFEGHVPVAPTDVGAIHAKERERMRAALRLGMVIAAAGLALGGGSAFAQSAPAETATNTPAPESIGPRELQNFSLSGTVTRPAEQAPAPAAAPPSRARATAANSQQQATEPRTSSASQASPVAVPSRGAPRVASTAPPGPAPTDSQVAAAPSVTVALPSLGSSPAAASGSGGEAAAAPANAGFVPEEETASLAPRHGFSLLPWLLAAAAIGAGAAFLFFWRSRSREAYAGAPRIDAYLAPEPTPPPRPAPAPAPTPKQAPPTAAPPPGPAGIVSTRLRPWLEVNFEPLRCVLEEDKVTFEFGLGLFNSGSAPARDVLVEGTLFNAGPSQENDIAAFFANPVGQGQRIAAIAPLQRMSLRTEVSAPRSALQQFEAAGRQVIIPLIAFNTLYRWGGSEGQSSLSFLLGKDTNGEKLAPFRLDLGPRVFRGLGARPLPQFVRR